MKNILEVDTSDSEQIEIKNMLDSHAPSSSNFKCKLVVCRNGFAICYEVRTKVTQLGGRGLQQSLGPSISWVGFKVEFVMQSK